MVESKKKIFAIVGPSCTYKTAISIELAKKHPFEIISADSRLVYKGMDIGTSKPTVEERAGIPHYLIDVIEPDKDYSVAIYKNECEIRIEEITKRKKIPLFVGGTGLYLNSVLLGLSLPDVQPDVSFRRQLKDFSQEELYKRLQSLDPKATEIIHRNDNFRTVRALEVIYKTNKLFSELKSIKESPYDVTWIGLSYEDRDFHEELIKKRAFGFCGNGLIEEVKNLVSKYGELEILKKTIGYSEVLDFLRNTYTLEETIGKITQNTRALAKRQMTWFKANKSINWIYLDKLDYRDALDKVFSLIDEGSLANTSIVS